MKADGPATVVKAVIDHFGLGAPIVVGYDWGAAIALKMAVRRPSTFKQIVAFHPSYNEAEKDELKKCKTPTLVSWCKQDQFHPWNKWQTLAKKLPKATIEVFEVKPYKSEAAWSAYAAHQDEYLPQWVKFVTGIDPLGKPQEVFEAKREQTVSTHGNAVTQINTVMLQKDLTAEEMQRLGEKPDASKLATEKLLKVDIKELIKSRLNSTHPMRQEWKVLLKTMPDLSPDSLRANPEVLVEQGIWPSLPTGIQQLKESPRLCVG